MGKALKFLIAGTCEGKCRMARFCSRQDGGVAGRVRGWNVHDGILADRLSALHGRVDGRVWTAVVFIVTSRRRMEDRRRSGTSALRHTGGGHVFRGRKRNSD